MIEQRFIECLRKQNLGQEKNYEQYKNMENLSINYQPIESYYVYRNVLIENTKSEHLDDVIIQNVININLKKNPKFRFYFGKPDRNFKIHFICDYEGIVKFDNILSVYF